MPNKNVLIAVTTQGVVLAASAPAWATGVAVVAVAAGLGFGLYRLAKR